MSVSGLLILTLIGVTSAGAYTIGVRSRRLRRTSLRLALGKLLECVGVAFIFLVVNTALGFAAVLMLRALGPAFVSLYVVADPALAILSVAQAIAFQALFAVRDTTESSSVS